jgi:hypothetical protein
MRAVFYFLVFLPTFEASSYVFGAPHTVNSSGSATAAKSSSSRPGRRRTTSSRNASGTGARPRTSSILKATTPPGRSTTTTEKKSDDEGKYALVDYINEEMDFYKVFYNALSVRRVCSECVEQVLGLSRDCKQDEIRRAYIGRSRICHPE